MTSWANFRANLTDAATLVGTGFTKRRRKPRTLPAWNGLEPLEQRSMMAASPLGPEVPANAASALNQSAPAVAVAANGDFVIVFQIPAPDGTNTDVYVRQFTADGTPKGVSVHVNPTVLSAATLASVSSDSAGDFVVTWTSTDELDSDVYARVFSADGTPTTDEFRVNSVTDGNQVHPTVAMDNAGDFVIGWAEETEVDFRRFTLDGTPVGADVKASDSVAGSKDTLTFADAAVAVDSNGDFVVGWAETKISTVTATFTASFTYPGYDDNGNPTGPVTVKDPPYEADVDRLAYANVNIKRYNASGVQQGSVIAAFNSTKAGATIDEVKVAMDSSGDFVVGYKLGLYDNQQYPESPSVYIPTPTGDEVWSRRFTASGTGATASAVAVTLPTFINGFGVDIDNSGGVTVTWATDNDLDETAIQAVRYDSTSKVDGPVFPINSFVTSNLADPAVAILDSGNILFAFTGSVVADTDVFFRRFEPSKANLSGTFGSITVGKGGTSALGATLIPGDQVTATITITNGPESALAVNTTTEISVYASSDHAFGGDILLGKLVGQKLQLAIGGSASYNFSWIVGTNTPPGAYRLYALVDSAGTTLETTEADNVADAGSDVNVGWDFGNIGGRNAKLVLNDADGTAVTYTLKGAGKGALDVNGNLTLTDTNAATSVVVAAKKGKTAGDNGLSDIGTVTVNGSLKSFAGKTTFLKGDFNVTGTIASLAMKGAGAAGTPHAIHITGTSTAASITFGDVVDMGVNSNAPIKKLAANSWTGAAADWVITSPITSIAIKGVASLDLLATGDVKAISVGVLLNSRIFAGVNPALTNLPGTLGDITGTNTIGSFTVKGVSGQSFAFVNSLIAAKTISKISLKQVKFDSGPGAGTIGVLADELKSYKRDSTGLSNLSAAGDNDVNNTYKVQIV